MRNVKWAEKAAAEFLEAIDFISDESEAAAKLVYDRIQSAAEKLGKRPIGRPSRMLGLYEKSVSKTSYILVYELTDDTVHIIRLIRSAQNWTPQGFPDA
jgi:plasmid stabilization system protein ParE